MNSGFDPYLEWLDLEVSAGPPDHYQLLGLKRFETDPEAIADAADRALSRVRSHRPGDHARAWAQLLDEISAAKTCLMDPTSREEYDHGLEEDSVDEEESLFGLVGEVAMPAPPTVRSDAPKSSSSARRDASPIANPVPQLTSNPAFENPIAVPGENHSPVPGVVAPLAEPTAPANAAAQEYAAPVSSIPGFANAQAVVPGFPAPTVPGQAAPLIDPMAPLDTTAIARIAAPAAGIPGMPGQVTQIPGFANIAPELNPMAPAPIPIGQAISVPMAQPAMAQPAMAQPAMAQPAMAQPAMAQPVSGFPAPACPDPPRAAAKVASPAAAGSADVGPDPAPELGVKRSAAAIARSRSQSGMMMPVLAGIAVGLLLLTIGGIYVFMGGRNEAGVVAQAPSAYDANGTRGTLPPSNAGPDGSTSGPSIDPVDPPVVPPTETDPTSVPPVMADPTAPEPAPAEPAPPAPPTPPAPAPPEPAPPTPPAPTPPEPSPPQPSRADLVQLSTKLKSARAALARHDFAAARKLVEEAEPLVMLDAHREKLDRLRQVTDYAAGFQAAIVAGVGKLQGGESLQIKDSNVGIVETSADRVVLRVAGQNRRYELSKLPLGLAVAFAHQAVSPTDAQTIAQKACFVITSPEVDAAGRTKARDWLVEAAASLPGVADLAGVMDDDYDLVAGFVAPTDSPAPPATPDPATGPTREDVIKLAAALTAARKAIAARDQQGTETQLAAAEALAKRPDHKQKLWRLQRLAEHVGAFDEAMKEAVAALNPGDLIKVGSSTELTVQRVNPASLAVEVAGLKKSYPLDNPPLGLAVALVQTVRPPDDPLTKVIQAAFVVVSKNSDDRSLAKARTWYEESAAENPDFADLGAVIDDDYNLLKDFQEE